jgi:hypothetical protein
VEGGGWRVEGGGWRVAGGGWRVAGGGWRVEGGGWRVEGGEWRVEGGGWRAAGRGRAGYLRQPVALVLDAQTERDGGALTRNAHDEGRLVRGREERMRCSEAVRALLDCGLWLLGVALVGGRVAVALWRLEPSDSELKEVRAFGEHRGKEGGQ